MIAEPTATDPVTAVEWQEAVNLAHGYLLLDSARQYGLLTGGPEVNVPRACSIIERGARLGVRPQGDVAVAMILKMHGGQ